MIPLNSLHIIQYNPFSITLCTTDQCTIGYYGHLWGLKITQAEDEIADKTDAPYQES